MSLQKSSDRALDGLTVQASVPGALERLVHLLEDRGVACVSSFVGPTDLSALVGEHEQALSEDIAGIESLDYPQGEAVRMRQDELPRGRLATTRRVFAAPLMQQVATALLGARHRLNHEIYISRDQHGPHNPLNELHFDKIPTLKFFLYLNDVDTSNGAFECVPGSHLRARELARYHRRRGTRVVDLPNRHVPGDLGEPLSMEAPAGSMIVFSTDVFHRAGRVQPTRERHVIRGHTRRNRTVGYAPRALSGQWLQESALNPTRYYFRLVDRLLGP